MKIKNLLLYLSFLTTLNVIQTKAEDLSEEYKTQQDCSWNNTVYKFVNYQTKGGSLGTVERGYCIDKKSNIYEINGNSKYWLGYPPRIDSGPIRIGNLKKSELTTGNSCFYGVNAQCLSNVINTTTQYKIEGKYLKKYTRSDFNGSKGEVDSSILGIHKNAKKELLAKAISFNELAIKAYEEGKIRKAFVAASSGTKWLNNQFGYYFLSYLQFHNEVNLEKEKGLLKLAKKNIDTLIKYGSSWELGLDSPSTQIFVDFDSRIGIPQTIDKAAFYHLRGMIISQNINQYQAEEACHDFKKAIALKPKWYPFDRTYQTICTNPYVQCKYGYFDFDKGRFLRPWEIPSEAKKFCSDHKGGS